MSADQQPTDGYCTVCGQYGRGKWRAILSERHELIDDHQGCPGYQPLIPQHPRQTSKRSNP